MRMALLGASGCGKSVTLKCIAGIMTPDMGHIILDGETLFDSEKHINLPPQKRRVGCLFLRSLSEHDGAAEHPVRHPLRQLCRKAPPRGGEAAPFPRVRVPENTASGERTTAAFNILADKCLCYK